MKRSRTELLVLLLLVTGCFSLATLLDPRISIWRAKSSGGSVMQVLLGDGRRLFANQFFTEADVSFHGGYYPSIFDKTQAPKDKSYLTGQSPAPRDAHDCSEHAGQDHDAHQHDANSEVDSEEEAHEKAMAFLGPPRDWIEAFGRHFMITEHTHLAKGQQKEMLPWLRMAAELDPNNVQTYTVTAYWLRSMGKLTEAEQFLREGQRNNPDSYEILLELGRLWLENHHDPERARNLWELAVQKWTARNEHVKEPDTLNLSQITIRLARLEEEQTNYPRAIYWLELTKKGAPHPEELESQILALKAKLSAPQNPAPRDGSR